MAAYTTTRRAGSDSGAVSDFDPNALLQAQGEHEKSISDLTDRISKIESSLATPQALAVFLEESARDSRQLEGVFAKMFCRFMAEHREVQEAVRKKIEEVDKSYFSRLFRRFGMALYTVAVAVISVIGKNLLDWVISLIPHY
jgi:hypothetical protein